VSGLEREELRCCLRPGSFRFGFTAATRKLLPIFPERCSKTKRDVADLSLATEPPSYLFQRTTRTLLGVMGARATTVRDGH
jgi:hypothetical protein